MHFALGKIIVRLGPALAGNSPPDYCILMGSNPSAVTTYENNTHLLMGVIFMAEMEGFEPPHALRRLADFESAPFSHLGTSP